MKLDEMFDKKYKDIVKNESRAIVDIRARKDLELKILVLLLESSKFNEAMEENSYKFFEMIWDSIRRRAVRIASKDKGRPVTDSDIETAFKEVLEEKKGVMRRGF